MDWISVDDKMPPINVTPGVLVYSLRGGIDVQPVYNNGKWEPKFHEGWNKGEYFEVTHWQELPKPPPQ